MACCKTVLFVLGFFGIICIILGVILGFVVLPDVITRTIKENARLEKGTPQFERWRRPFPLTFKVYFFEVKNWREIVTGSKPVVKEKGPYIYTQMREKRDIEYDADKDTLFYYQDMYFEFDRLASYPLRDDEKIKTLNVPLMNVFQLMESNPDLSLKTIDDHWQEAFPEMNIFDEFTIKEYLFDGITFCTNLNTPICQNITKAVQDVRTFKTDDEGISFAFFRHKHDTDDGSYLIRAGIDKIEDLGLILEWRRSPYLQMWEEGDTCKNLRGRDSTISPPHITNEDVFDVFQSDICRIVTLEYDGAGEHFGIPGYRQELRKDTLTNTGNQSCFCTRNTKNINGEPECWADGFMDLYRCKVGTMVMSQPHFLDADEELASTVEGLNPKKDNHTTFIIVEPSTGTPLSGATRMQFNMVLRRIEDINITRELKGAVLPLMWVEESMELPPNLVRDLRQRYFDQLVIVDVLTWVLIGFGILLFVGGGILVFVC